MAKDPAFLFYPNDYIGGTMGMTFEEKGAYMELLMMQFNRGHMTTHMIGQVLGQDGGQLWVKLSHKFIQDENGLWYNERLDIEKKKRKAFTESRKNNIKGTNQYTLKQGKKRGHMTSHMENENINENINIDAIELNKEAEKYFHKKFINKTSLDLFDKLIRIDGYTKEQILQAIKFGRGDPFWTTNFLSPQKLRNKNKDGVKYIDVFLAKIMNNETSQTSQRGNGKGYAATNEQLAASIAKHFPADNDIREP